VAETLVQFMVALFMSLGALCLFIWAVLSGLFTDVEGIAYRVYRREVSDDERSTTDSSDT
jgi:cbb3-type cytochrome oxidase maturation protein